MSLYYLTSHSGKEVVYFVYILKAAILIFSMVEVRYDHIPIHTYHALFTTIPE